MNLHTFFQKGISYSLQSVKADRDLVRHIQINFNRLGFDCGSADGLWGQKTQGAFNAFTAKHCPGEKDFTVAIAKLLIELPNPAPARRQINQAGLQLIKEFEGCRLAAYLCPAGVATIGYGSTSNVRLGMKITQAQAEALLRQDLERFERAVELAVKVPLTDNQFAALVSFAFNVGIGALERSTLLRLLNQGAYRVTVDQFAVWNKADGRVLSGLTRRRKAEQSLFLKP